MKLVVDSCIGVAALLPEVHSPKSAQLFLDFASGIQELIAPDVFPIEIAHALTRAERKGLIKALEAVRLLGQFSDVMPQLYDSLPLLTQATELSSLTRHGVYDLLYKTLGEHEGCQVVTLDDKLIKQFPKDVIHLDDV